MSWERQLPKDILRNINKYRVSRYKNTDDEVSKLTRLVALIEKRCKGVLGNDTEVNDD